MSDVILLGRDKLWAHNRKWPIYDGIYYGIRARMRAKYHVTVNGAENIAGLEFYMLVNGDHNSDTLDLRAQAQLLGEYPILRRGVYIMKDILPRQRLLRWCGGIVVMRPEDHEDNRKEAKEWNKEVYEWKLPSMYLKKEIVVLQAAGKTGGDTFHPGLAFALNKSQTIYNKMQEERGINPEPVPYAPLRMKIVPPKTDSSGNIVTKGNIIMTVGELYTASDKRELLDMTCDRLDLN